MATPSVVRVYETIGPIVYYSSIVTPPVVTFYETIGSIVYYLSVASPSIVTVYETIGSVVYYSSYSNATKSVLFVSSKLLKVTINVLFKSNSYYWKSSSYYWLSIIFFHKGRFFRWWQASFQNIPTCPEIIGKYFFLHAYLLYVCIMFNTSCPDSIVDYL